MIHKSYALVGMVVCFVFGMILGSLLSGQKTGERPVASTQMPIAPANQEHAALEKRVQDIERALSKEPGKGTLWVDLGNAYFDLDVPDQAILAYEHAMSCGVRTADLLTDLGVMYRRVKQYERALGLFQEAKKLDPQHLQSRLNEGIVLLYDLSKTQPAIAAWEEVLAINPSVRLSNGDLLADVVSQLKTRAK